MMAKYARTRENQRTREATGSPEIPSRALACFALRALRVRSQPLFPSTGGTSEDIVIRSRITCSLNDLT